MAAIIDRQSRIAGTRITIYDVWTYAEAGWHSSSIAGTLGISSHEVQAALDYIEANHAEVMATYESIMRRIERGNPPQIASRQQQSHQRLQAKLRQLQAQGEGKSD